MHAPRSFAIALLALGATADRCLYCSWADYSNPEAPTYDCGVKCGYKHLSTSEPNWHCWITDHAMNDCFKKCCRAADKVPVSSKCTVLGDCF